MKPIKMLGFALAAALVAMALAGTTAAMAESTALCEEDESPCTAENSVTHVHEVSTEKAKLLASPEVQCDVLFLGDVTSTGSPLVIEGAFTYTNCGSGCSVTEENSPLTLNVLKEGHELAKVTSGTGSGAGLVNVNCSGIQCRYVGSGLVGHGLGPLLSARANGDVTLKEQTVSHESGFFCPSSGKLDITTTPLVTTYIAGEAAELLYCVEYQHNTNGFYSDSECTNGPVAGRPYDLMEGPAGQVVGQSVCTKMNTGGLWKGRVSNKECKEDALSLQGGGYERGTITKVY